MNAHPEPRAKRIQLVAQGIIWIGAIIAASIVLSAPGDHWFIISILVCCAITSLSIVAYQPKTGSRVAPETPGERKHGA
jgi:uncharacterized membrane protein